MSDPAPRVSILIPNYNNGKASSINGQTDLLGDLLQSIQDTLGNDPTPLEVIAYDDGSTDDSLDTLRTWAKKTWRGGQVFLKLIEAEHTGVLSIGANRLVRESAGDILVRLDGDTVMLTPNWAALLCETFDQGHPRLGVLGPKQLRLDGKIHAFGDWLLHPKGYHHIYAGQEREAVNHALEVDHVMGCFYCCKRAVYDDVGGYDESILRGQTIDFGLAARLKGWACFAIPHVEYTHRHGLRGARKTTADTDKGVKKTLDTFREKWGFDRIAPDLDVVREKYTGTPLLWNAQVFGTPTAKPIAACPADQHKAIERSEWAKYGRDAKFKADTELRAGVALQVLSQIKPQKDADKPKRFALIGCRSGLIPHLLAGQGLTCTGTDTDPNQISIAQQFVASQTYPASPPSFVHQPDIRRVPLDDGSADIALVYDQLETHDNPVALLRDTHRVLADDGLIVILTQRQEHTQDPYESQRRYKAQELIMQVQGVRGWDILSDPNQGNPDHPLILIARKRRLPASAAEAPNESSPAEAAA